MKDSIKRQEDSFVEFLKNEIEDNTSHISNLQDEFDRKVEKLTYELNTKISNLNSANDVLITKLSELTLLK